MHNITLFLIDGEPDGLREIKIDNWDGVGLVFPRNKLQEINTEEWQKPAIYFLFGKESENSPVSLTYIGKARNLSERLNNHNRDENKDFWHMTVAFMSNRFITYLDYLEASCLKQADEANHFGFHLENGNRPQLPILDRNNVFVAETDLKNINLLLTTVGYPILQKMESITKNDLENPLFYCQNKDMKAKGIARMTNEGFILYKGSTLPFSHSKSIMVRNEKIISELLLEKIIKENDAGYMVEQNYIFAKPSTPADLIVGYSVNGWDIWKTEDGKTLDEVYRK